MKFVVDDGVELRPGSTPKWIEDAINVLKKMPDGKLLTTRRLAETISRSFDYVQHESGNPEFGPFKLRHGGKCYFGNQRTIASAREQFSA